MSRRVAIRAIVFAQRHRWLFRVGRRSWWSRFVWWAMDTPSFRESIEQGERDMDAGRKYKLDTDTRKIMPDPAWPLDGPQPDYPRGVWSDWR